MADHAVPVAPRGAASATYRAAYRRGYRDGLAQNAQSIDAPSSDDKRPARDDHHAPTRDDQAGPSRRKPLYKRPVVVGLALLVLLAAIIAAIVFWRHSRHHETTDDAFIDGIASAVAAQTGGRVVGLLVDDNQVVHAGDLLLEIDARDNEARAAQARAQLANSQSQLESARAQVEVRRASIVQLEATVRQAGVELARAERDAARFAQVDADAVPRQRSDAVATAVQSARAQLDAARSNVTSARAQVTAATAAVSTAEAGVTAARAAVDAATLQVSYTRVTAPIDGRITHRSVNVGNVVSTGQPLLSIVSESLWVTANYKETQLTRMRPGQQVEVTIDAYPAAHFRGHVESIQRATGAYFSLLPAENATGNFVKVVQRVPVKIVFDDARVRDYAIGPGMSVKPDVTIP